MRTVIGLCDCNNFYISCERVFNPALEGRPVGVLSNNDGCVIARSEELKRLGIPMGMPLFKIPQQQRRHIILRSSNYALYGDMSSRVTATLRQQCPEVEVYSVDESFLMWDGFTIGEIDERCRQLCETVQRNTGIPVSIGLSTSRTLAKVANHCAKKNAIYQGVCWLDPDSSAVEQVLTGLPVDELWGVSRRLADRLAVMGITTAWQLRQAEPKYIRSRFSVVQEKLVWELRGRSCIDTEMATAKQNVMTSRSFGRLTDKRAEVREAIRMHAQRGAEKLRRQGSQAQGVLVFLKTNRHRQELPQYHPSLVVPLVTPSNDTAVLLAAAQRGLAKIWKDGFLYMKAGVMMLDLVDANTGPDDLFNATGSVQAERRQSLMTTLDQLNQRMGRNTVSFGGVRKEAAWHLKSDYLSQHFTTRWDELVEAKTD